MAGSSACEPILKLWVMPPTRSPLTSWVQLKRESKKAQETRGEGGESLPFALGLATLSDPACPASLSPHCVTFSCVFLDHGISPGRANLGPVPQGKVQGRTGHLLARSPSPGQARSGLEGIKGKKKNHTEERDVFFLLNKGKRRWVWGNLEIVNWLLLLSPDPPPKQAPFSEHTGRCRPPSYGWIWKEPSGFGF